MPKVEDIPLNACNKCGGAPNYYISDDLLTFTCVIECDDCHSSVQSEEQLTEYDAAASAAKLWNEI